jgi:hypothetical protein
MIWLLAGDGQQVKTKLNSIIGQQKDNVLIYEDSFNINRLNPSFLWFHFLLKSR